jgi:hypothetical protein
MHLTEVASAQSAVIQGIMTFNPEIQGFACNPLVNRQL